MYVLYVFLSGNGDHCNASRVRWPLVILPCGPVTDANYTENYDEVIS
jgi:hypothetical protein